MYAPNCLSWALNTKNKNKNKKEREKREKKEKKLEIRGEEQKFDRRPHHEAILSRCSAVDKANDYGLNDRGFGVRVLAGSRIATSPYRPDRLWEPPGLLSNGHSGFSPRE
jgi:hypothetical protein